jgi:hypothetical protein
MTPVVKEWVAKAEQDYFVAQLILSSRGAA